MPRSHKKNGRWQDHYAIRAKKENYPARSVYKLKEIQHRYGLISAGDRVLDLGCAPGSWLQLAAELVGARGAVIGIDLKPVTVKLPDHAVAYTGNILEDDPELEQHLDLPFDVVISDMAPATTGHRDVDAARSLQLCEAALAIAQKRLRTGGRFL